MSRAHESFDSPRKPTPREVEVNEGKNSPRKVGEGEERLKSLAQVIKKNQQAIQILKLELSDKDRVIKEIMDRM